MNSLKILFITGLSGAGKTTARRAAEDLGYNCTENLPIPLLDAYVEKMQVHATKDRTVLVVDSRVGRQLTDFVDKFPGLRDQGVVLDLIYLDARDDVLVRRFSEARRPHHLADGGDLTDGIQRERTLLEPVKELASVSIDTSDLTVHELRRTIQERYGSPDELLTVTFLSFGFRHGVPAHADLVLDVRFLPNPYFVDGLREQTGKDAPVSDYVLEQTDAGIFLGHLVPMLRFLVPKYVHEGKAYLTVGIGCTGGQHRSVAIAEELGRQLRDETHVQIMHRDCPK